MTKNYEKIGYYRVSIDDQETGLQLDALTRAGCGPLYHDEKSGRTFSRPALQTALASLQEGDSLVAGSSTA